MSVDHELQSEEADAVYLDDDAVVVDVDDQGAHESPEFSDMEEEGNVDNSLYTFEEHAEAVYSVAWHPHHGIIASGGGDDMAYIWQDEGRGSFLTLRGHSDTVTAVKFNKVGDLLATASLDGRVRIWVTSTAACKHMLEGPEEGLNWLQWHPSGNVVVAGSEDFSCWMWNADTGACMQVFSGHTGAVDCGTFTPNGKLLVTGGGDGDASLRVWNPKTGTPVSVAAGPGFHEAGLTCVEVTTDSGACISGSADGSIYLTHISTGKVLASLSGHEQSVEAIKVCSHLAVIASVGLDGKLLLWDAARHNLRASCSHTEVAEGAEESPSIVALAVHGSEPWAVTASLDGVLRVWDMRTGQLLQSRQGHRQGIQDVALSPSGRLAVTASDDGTCKVFDIVD